MLRSASTPSLGSPVPSFTAESPRKHAGQISCNTASFHTVAKSMVSSPDSAENIDLRRAQSAGNLEDCFNINVAGEDFMTLSRQSSRRLSRKPTLEAIQSFYPSDGEDEEEDDDDEELVVVVEGSFNPLNLATSTRGVCDMGFPGGGKMYLAAGIGVNAVSFLDDCGYGGHGGWGGGGGNRPGDNFNRDGGDNRGISMEDHYKNMLLQSPGNPLFLRNYAHFLYQTKGDLAGAELYYSRAILADPEDGDILCQYARVIWELHHDQERARSYFERAIQASSQDSNINASYASFLWDIEGDEDEDVVTENPRLGAPFFHHGIMASATA